MNVYFLVDRSGSMTSRWEETIQSLNTYVSELKNNKVKKTKVNVFLFDSSDTFLPIRENIKLKKWEPLDPTEASPRNMTPLYDAIGKLHTKVEEDNPERATVIILTDGLENCSREHNNESAKKLLDKFRKKNFDVVFIGADFDAFAQSKSLGNSSKHTLNMKNAKNYAPAMRHMATRAMAYAATGQVLDIDNKTRAAATGNK